MPLNSQAVLTVMSIWFSDSNILFSSWNSKLKETTEDKWSFYHPPSSLGVEE